LTFAGERADLARQLSQRLAPLLVTDSLDQVFRDLEMPLLPVLADVERAGILIDGPALAAQSQHIERELGRYTERIYGLAGQEFNINSPKQLGEILFERMQLPALKKTGKTRSASTAVAADPGMAWASQAEEHLHRRATPIGAPAHRTRSHEFQPGSRSNRPSEQLGSESTEHSDPYRTRAADPTRVRRRTGPRTDFSRLLAD
jgi:hypothetical protein